MAFKIGNFFLFDRQYGPGKVQSENHGIGYSAGNANQTIENSSKSCNDRSSINVTHTIVKRHICICIFMSYLYLHFIIFI